jgi:hypothetical protein
MSRTPEEVFEELSAAFGSGDLEKASEAYSDDCIQIWNGHTKRGRSGVREGLADFVSDLGEMQAYEEPVKLFEDNVLYLEWWADLGDRRCVGVDTLVFQDGQITVHTIKYDFKELGDEPW